MSLKSSKSFVKRTKKGNVIKVVREHYLRDDIGTGIGKVLEEDVPCYIIPDTNVVLHQITVLEHESIKNVILLETVLDEVKNQNQSVYNRVRTLIDDKGKHFYLFSNEHHKETYIGERQPSESINDRNDRAIRVATLWYMRKLSESKIIYLLTNDKENLRKAKEMEVNAKTIHEFIKENVKELNNGFIEGYYSFPIELLDFLNYSDELSREELLEGDRDLPEGGKMAKKNLLFEEHVPLTTCLRKIKMKKYFQGRLRINRNNINEGYVVLKNNLLELGVDLKELGVQPEDISNTDVESNTSIEVYDTILIQNFKHLNRALNGDICAVEMLPKTQWAAPSKSALSNDMLEDEELTGENNGDKDGDSKSFYRRFEGKDLIPTGKIVGIIKRNWKTYCGSLDEETELNDGANKVLFVPVDRSIPKIRILTRQVKELINKRISVTIDSWDASSKYPDGHYVSTIGEIYDKDAESKVILLEHDVPHYQFSQAIMECLPNRTWEVEAKDMEHRRDLRHLNIVSVDPPGCTDIDDALHAIQFPDGTIEIGVHIADVTHFVKEGTMIDIEAAKRGTTVYLVDRRIEMLPSLLTNQICSLRENVDRLAFSVVWKFNEKGDMLSVDYFKSVIRSRRSLTYEQAQVIIDDKARDDELATDLRLLLKISRILKERRFESGSLTLASPAVKFYMETESSNPTDVELYQLRETNSMVEEFMLLANIAVAKKIVKEFPMVACLRRHPSPDPKRFEPLLKVLRKHGMDLDITSSKTLNDSLEVIEEMTKKSGDPYLNTLVRILVTRCMEQAVYFISGDVSSNEYWHYGLAVPIYTHFTSPIRRYADVIVHRLLGAAIGIYPLTPKLTDREYSRRLMQNLNRRNRFAQYSQRSSVELFTNIYFNINPVDHVTCYVVDIRDNAVVVFIPKYGFEHVIYLNNENTVNGKFEYQEKTDSLIIPFGKQKVQVTMFQSLHVRIFVKTAKNYRRKLCIEIIEPNVMKLDPEFPFHLLKKSEKQDKQESTTTIEEITSTNNSGASSVTIDSVVSQTDNDLKRKRTKDKLMKKLKQVKK
ncbi:hypothetical protein ABK040_014096 [Willaertia magna]